MSALFWVTWLGAVLATAMGLYGWHLYFAEAERLEWLDANYAGIEWLVPNSDPPVCEVFETFEGVRRPNPKGGSGYSLREAIDNARGAQ